MLRFRRTRISAAHPVGTFTPFEAMSSALWYSWMFRCLRCTEPPACPETAGNWERAKAIEERTKVVKCQRRFPFAERWTDRKEGFWRRERSRCASLEEKSSGWIQAGCRKGSPLAPALPKSSEPVGSARVRESQMTCGCAPASAHRAVPRPS